MNIRKATEADAPAIASLLHMMVELRRILTGPVEATAANVARNLQAAVHSTTTAIYIAETAEGEITGYCAVHWVPFLFLKGGEAYVTELWVRSQESGKGIGTKLLDLITAEARDRGCSRVSLLNGMDSEAYHRQFYAKRGWTERKRMANFIYPLPNMAKGSG
jgi:N-acetylglutamate synthase-like GNAT family acetyltransferase